MDTIKRMRYSQYKEHYADCRTVPGTYDKINRSIEVVIPDGRMKPSGVSSCFAIFSSEIFFQSVILSFSTSG